MKTGADGAPLGTAQGRLRLVSRGLGPPALAARGLTAVGASILFILGVVSEHALGLTPVVFLASSLFFVLTAMSYIEGNSVHPEGGGASTLSRYAFDELVSFVAGWAIILDYLIVMAIGIFSISHYLAAFWGEAGRAPAEILIAAAAMAWVCWSNVRGISVRRARAALRVGLAFLALCLLIVVVGLATQFRPDQVTDSIHLGSTPEWGDLLFAMVLAGVAATGIEAASGLAPDVRVGRRGLRNLVVFSAVAVFVILVGVSTVSTMAVPPVGGHTVLGSQYVAAPLLGTVSAFHPHWLSQVLRYAVGGLGAVVLLQAVNSTMVGFSRIAYSLATNRQIPSLLGRLHPKYGTPYVAVCIASVLSFALACSSDIDFLAGIFAFGAMLAFAIAHLSVVALRYREPNAARVYRVPLNVRVRGVSVPLPAVFGGAAAAAGWLSVLVLHAGARYVGGTWLIFGIVLYVAYRRGQGKPLRARFTIPAAALQDAAEAEYGSILVPVFGNELDDDIVGTAGRLASEEGDEGEGGAVIEALFVVEVPMSLPLDARVPDEQIARAKAAVRRAKEVGEEYEGVVVATAMVRARSVGAAIVSEAKRRGVEAIVLAAEAPTRTRGGALLGGRGGPRDRSVGEVTRYVVEKAPCRVILTAAPATDNGAGPTGERERDPAD
ncbi:MAG: basic amino acid/polyamine antiporter, family [Thermoleophilaceae bacterium]|nr:basic amino acid/polyamine antiporter, family [Thermoleophilaceae bacterium]